MKKCNQILESLTFVHEAKAVPIVPPNKDNSTPNGKKHGDTIKILKGYDDRFPRGSIWRCETVAGDEYENNGKINKYNTFVYIRINAITGEETKSNLNKINMSGFNMVTPEGVEKIFTRGEVAVLTPGQPYSQGEVTTEDVRMILGNLDADKVTGVALPKLVGKASVNSSTVDIDLRLAKAEGGKMEKLFNQILKALDSRGMTYKLIDNWNRVEKALPDKGYTDFIEVFKRNGG